MNKATLARFQEMLSRQDAEIDLPSASLLIASDEYPTLDISHYQALIAEMTGMVRCQLRTDPRRDGLHGIEVLNETLFKNLHFRGNVEDYYNPRNSFLNEVIERRTGIPITLSVLYLSIGRGIGLDLFGVGMPGHFLVKCVHSGLEVFVDPFSQGEILLEQDCERKHASIRVKEAFDPAFLEPVSNRQILMRILANLKNIYLSQEDYTRGLRTIERMLLVNPVAAAEIRDRGSVHYQLKSYSLALGDWSHYLTLRPDAADAHIIAANCKELRAMLASASKPMLN